MIDSNWKRSYLMFRRGPLNPVTFTSKEICKGKLNNSEWMWNFKLFNRFPMIITRIIIYIYIYIYILIPFRIFKSKFRRPFQLPEFSIWALSTSVFKLLDCDWSWPWNHCIIITVVIWFIYKSRQLLSICSLTLTWCHNNHLFCQHERDTLMASLKDK